MPSITKLELQQQLALVNEEYRIARERIAALEADLAIARKAAPAPRPAPLTKPEPLSYTSYYDYVAACRVYARKAGLRVATYVSVAQWNKLVGESLCTA